MKHITVTYNYAQKLSIEEHINYAIDDINDKCEKSDKLIELENAYKLVIEDMKLNGVIREKTQFDKEIDKITKRHKKMSNALHSLWEKEIEQAKTSTIANFYKNIGVDMGESTCSDTKGKTK